MKKLSLISLVVFAALVAYAANIADHLLGVVAFTYEYLAFCFLVALAFGGAWHACQGKAGSLFALAVFGVLGANLVLPPPPERLLRSVMLNAPPGTEASTLVDLVKEQYADSPYEMPWVHEDRAGGFDRVHVSLLSQKERSCTSVIFLLENGRVSYSIFSPD